MMRWQTARLAGALALGALVWAGCGRTVEVLMDCPSPDGQYVATSYMVHGDLSAPLHTRLSLRQAREWLKADSYILQLTGGYEVRVAWLSPRRLRVEYPDDARVDLAQPRISDGETIDVTYSARPGRKGLLDPSGNGCLGGRGG